MGDIKNLKEGLNDTVDAISEELEIKKNVLNKAIKVAFKMSENRDELADGREELDEVEEILMAAGKAKR
jgi:hypothetical protein